MTQSTDTYRVKSFLNTNDNTLSGKLPTLTDNSFPEPERIKHILIGSPRAVMGTIRVLHQLGYAQVSEWSPLQASSNPGEVMSILVRSITVR